MAIGEVLVLMLGKIDLSAGQVFLFAPWVMYWLWQLGVPVGWGIVAAMVVCAGVGLVLIFSDDTEASPIPGALPPQTSNVAPHVGLFGQVFGVWLWSEIIWVAVIALVVNFMLKRTRFGVRVIATGGNLMGAAETVHQDLALVPRLPVFQNLFLNHEITRMGPIRALDKHKMRELARQYLDGINVNVPNVDTEAGQPSGGQRQAIAVARATRADANILLLDEPLAAMGARESRLIIDLVKELASSGKVSIIIINHNYAHLFHLCDRVNVMQQGRISIDRNVEDTSLEELTELMVSSNRSQLQDAAALPQRAPRPPAPTAPPSEQRKNRIRIGVIGGLVLAVVVAVSLILALNSGHHSHKSTASSTTTTVAVTTTTGPPAHKVVLAQVGTGISTTAPFRVDVAPWVLAWTYSCGTTPGNFIVTVTQDKNAVAGDPVVDELGLKGSGTQAYHNTGLFNLKVISECKWTVRVTNG